MKVVAIIQARMGSQRLPGKSMMEIADKPLLWYVIERVKKAKSLDSVILATSTKPENDPLCRLAEELNVEVFRGSEIGVLSRYVEAGRGTNADIIVRICADNPLIDPCEIDRIVQHHIYTRSDYSFNHIPTKENNYPDGLGAEVIDAKILYSLSELHLTPEEKEHVTLHIIQNPDRYTISSCEAPYEIIGPDIKLDIDTPDDFKRMKYFIESLPKEKKPNWSAAEIVKDYRIFLKKKVIILINNQSEAIFFSEHFTEPLLNYIPIVTTPQAWWELEKRGIQTERIDKYFDRNEMYVLGLENFQKLETIFSFFDSALNETDPLIKKFGFELTRYNFFKLKIVFDNLTTKIRLLRKICERIEPDLILTFSTRSKENIYPLFNSDLQISLGHNWFSIILKIDGWKCETAIHIIPDQQQNEINLKKISNKIRQKVISCALGPLAFPLSIITKTLGYRSGISYFLSAISISNSGKKHLLCLDIGYDWDYIAYKLWTKGYLFCYPKKNFIFSHEPKRNFENIFADIKNKIALYCTIDDIDFTELFSSTILTLISEQIKSLPNLVKVTEHQIITQKPVAVICTIKTRIEEFIIARIFQYHKIPIISWQHGEYGPHQSPIALYSEFFGCDIHLSWGSGVSDMMMQERLNSFICKSIPVGSYNLQELYCNSHPDYSKKRILYVTTGFLANSFYVNLPIPFHDNELWEIQRKILDALGKSNLDVICKLHPSASDKIMTQEYVSQNSYKNINIFSNEKTFINLLKDSDIIICDLPSTVLLQSIASKKTIFVLLNLIQISEPAKKMLKKRAYCSETVPELLDQVHKYLNNEPMEQIPDIQNTEFLEHYGIHRGERPIQDRVIELLDSLC